MVDVRGLEPIAPDNRSDVAVDLTAWADVGHDQRITINLKEDSVAAYTCRPLFRANKRIR